MGSFKDVVGHKDILKYISSAVENNRVSHAYILNGERGSGKKMLANLFAMTLLCETGDNEPCGKCHSCKQAESGNHPDIIRVTHEKPNSIGVDDIREQINDTIMVRPYSSYYKVYIVDRNINDAMYWKKNFLMIEEEKNEYTNTAKVLKSCKKYIAKKENIEPEKRLELMNNSVEYFENNEEFDLEKFTEKVFDNQEESDKFKVYIDSYDVDNKFSISSNAVTKIKKTIKKCIKLDDNVEIKFSDTVDDIDNLIEKGYDREKKRKYYKIYYNDED